MSKIVERLNNSLPSISTPMMEGDNLAIVLCTAFDDGREETADDTGWSIAARNGYEEVIAAIRNHYRPAADTIAALTARVEELEKALQRMIDLCTVGANPGAFSNGVTDSSGTIDEGDVIAGRIIDEARAAITKRESNG